MVQRECHYLDSGAEFFGDDLASYRNFSIFCSNLCRLYTCMCGTVWESLNFQILIHLQYLTAQHPHNALMGVKFGTEEERCTRGTQSCMQDFSLVMVWARKPQNSKFEMYSYAVFFVVTQHCLQFLTPRINAEGNAIASVHLSVCLFPLHLRN